MNHRSLVPLLLLAACSPTSNTLSESDSRAVVAEVTSANMELLEALNAHDAPAVLAFYETGPQFQYIGCTSIVPTSDVFGAITAGYLRMRPDVTYEMTVTGLQVLNRNAAVATLTGESDSLKLFTTRVWRRGDDDRWKIAYEHESWPGCDPPPLPHPGTIPDDTRLLDPPPTGG